MDKLVSSLCITLHPGALLGLFPFLRHAFFRSRNPRGLYCGRVCAYDVLRFVAAPHPRRLNYAIWCCPEASLEEKSTPGERLGVDPLTDGHAGGTVRGARLVIGFRALLLAAGALPWGLAALGQSEAMRRAFAPFCHQLLERSLHFGAEASAMVLCSRCSGIGCGVALAALFPLPCSWLPRGRSMIFAALVLNLLQAAGHWLGISGLDHTLRIAVGAVLGWTVAGFVVARVRFGERLKEAVAQAPYE